MSLSNINAKLWVAGITSLVGSLLLLSEAEAVNGCRPKTPCACAADGTCAPSGPWGHSATKWRPWPGDDISVKSPDLDPDDAQEELVLPGSELPPAAKEDLRGSETPESRRKKSSRDDDEAAAEEPATDLGQELDAPLPKEEPLLEEEPQDLEFENPEPIQLEQPVEDAPMPEAEPVDDFDPFGSFDYGREVPKTARQPRQPTQQPKASGPPVLPASLKKLSRLNQPRQSAPKANFVGRPAAIQTMASLR